MKHGMKGLSLRGVRDNGKRSANFLQIRISKRCVCIEREKHGNFDTRGSSLTLYKMLRSG
jgi:hypothetical protein